MSNGTPLSSYVSGNLVSGTGNIQINGPIFNSHNTTNKAENIPCWLSTVEYEKHHKRARQGRTPGTCTWLFGNSEYVKWREASSSRILWLRGDPGVGKTTLVSSVIDRLAEEKERTAYFYCSRDEPIRRDPGEIFRTLLKQLALAPWDNAPAPGLAIHEVIVDDYKTRERNGLSSGRPDAEECIDLMSRITRNQGSNINIVIDALDEISISSREEVLENLQKLVKNLEAPVKILVSSRSEDDIFLHFRGNNAAVHYVQPGDNGADMEQFIAQELTACISKRKLLRGIVSEETKRFITNKLKENSHGMFLWAKLQLQHLCTLKHEDYIGGALALMPKGLIGMYDVIYNDILMEEPANRQIALAAIRWILGSEKLSSPALLIGAVYHSGVKKIIDIESILAVCHNLVVVDPQSEVIRFMHLSTREYLEDRLLDLTRSISVQAEVLNSLIRRYTITMTDTHQGIMDWRNQNDLSETLDYSKGRIQSFVSRLCLQSLTEDLEDFQPRARYLGAFLNYATEYWPHHLQWVSPDGRWEDPGLRRPFEDFLGTHTHPGGHFVRALERYSATTGVIHRDAPLVWSSSYLHTMNATEHYSHFFSQPVTPIFAASYFGLSGNFFEMYAHDINIRNSRNETALFLASQQGRSTLTRYLLENGADVNMADTDRFTPLCAAASQGHVEVMRQLLEYRAELTSTAMGESIRNGNIEAVHMLLDYGMDANVGLQVGTGPWHTAFKNSGGSSTASWLKMFTKRPPLRRSQASISCLESPLGLAVRCGYIEIVKLLLCYNSLPNFAALETAINQGSLEMVSLLLGSGMDVNECPREGKTVLSLAAEKGRIDLIRLLMEWGADINGGAGGALYGAIGQRHLEVARFLIHNGADVNAPGSFHSALQMTPSHYYREIVDLLLENGVKIHNIT